MILRTTLARWWLAGATIGTVALVLAVASWSAAHERAESLSEFSARQALLARAVAVDFEHRLNAAAPALDARAASDATLPDAFVRDLLAGPRRLEIPHELLILVARPGTHGFLTTDDRIIPSTRLRNAVDSGASTLVLERDEAVLFGLPRRRAMAGVDRVVTPSGARWGVVVIASAERLRDRQIHEERRLAITVVLVALAGIAFGAVSRRRQRKELELERRIAVGAIERERETALGKADRMAAVAALSSGMAHEIGTPLGIIVGRIEQVLDRTTDDRSARALGVVLEQVERIRSIVTGCLALARGDAPQLIATEPARLVENAVELVRHRFENANVELKWAVASELPAVACAPSLFEQALVNVLLNACEATPAGGAVRLSVAALERSIEIIVEDDGAGIPDEVARRATEPFFSTRRSEGGSGLGLTIAQEIVSHHAGTLRIGQRGDRAGTRVVLSLPREGERRDAVAG